MDGLEAIEAEVARLLEVERARLAQERTRRRGQINQRIHRLRHMQVQGYPFASQAGQDVVVDKLLKGKRGGRFVDIGGYDGVTGSNSLFFEQRRGWHGVLVEPVTALRDLAAQWRRCPCLALAVTPTPQEDAPFIEITSGKTQMGGLAESYDPAILAEVRADARHAERLIRVPARTLSALLVESAIPHPDFISLDIEGAELEVLRHFPFDRHDVAIWAIENNNGVPGIADIMGDAGYDLVEICGADEIWRKHGLSP